MRGYDLESLETSQVSLGLRHACCIESFTSIAFDGSLLASPTIRPRIIKMIDLGLVVYSPFSYPANINGNSIVVHTLHGGLGWRSRSRPLSCNFSPQFFRSNWLLRLKDRFLTWRDNSRILD